jgi:hypothetical protein
MAIALELARCEAWHIFQKNRRRLGFFDDSQCFRKQIAFVVRPKLLSRHREWRARHAGRKEINSAEIAAADLTDVGVDNAPLGLSRSVLQEGASISTRALKARGLKPKSLSTAARAQFQYRQSHGPHEPPCSPAKQIPEQSPACHVSGILTGLLTHVYCCPN